MMDEEGIMYLAFALVVCLIIISFTPKMGGGILSILAAALVAILGAFLAGPMAPSLLGDLGCDVIKVEQITGDRMRFMVRYFHAAGADSANRPSSLPESLSAL